MHMLDLERAQCRHLQDVGPASAINACDTLDGKTPTCGMHFSAPQANPCMSAPH